MNCYRIFRAAWILFPGLLILAGASWAQSPETPHRVSAVVVDIQDGTGDTSRWKEMAEALIYLKADEPFSDKKFRDSVEALRQSRFFQNIDIPDPDWKKRDITLTFRLTPFRRIMDIKIKGAFPLFEKEVLNAMTFYTGDAWMPEKLPEQEANIARLFVREGYISPKVTVTAEPDPDTGHYVVFVNIEKGDFYHVREVRITGNASFSATRLKLRLDTWKSSVLPGSEVKRFNGKYLDADVKNLVKFYRDRGYADVEVSSEIRRDEAAKSARVLININEGLKYRVKFDGNTEFWGMTLKKDLVFEEKGNAGDLGLRRSIRNIEDRYHKAGYLRARVRAEEDPEVPADGERRILLKIREGRRSIVDSIAVEGNQAFDAEKIEKQMLTRRPGIIADGEFVPEILEDDKAAVKSLYVKKGYMNPEIETEVTWQKDEKTGERRADVRLAVDEGVRTRVASVTFKGMGVITEADALKAVSLKPGEPFRQYMVQSDENTLSALISEKGYPHVRVKGNADIREDGAEAVLVYDVDEGPYVEMGEVLITGNFRTKPRVFLRELEIKPGDPFSLTRVLEAQRNIRNIGALNSASFKTPGLEEKAERVNLLVEAGEKKPYFFQVSGGYDTSRKMFGTLSVGDRNIFGLNRDAEASLEVSQIGYRGELSLTEPRFFDTRISSTGTMFAEQREEFNKTFGTRTYGSTLEFDRDLWKYLTASLVFRYEFREQYQTGDEAIPAEDSDLYDPRNILVTTPSLIYNSTDSFIRPTKGMYSAMSVDISKGLGDSLDDFFKYRFETRYYVSPAKRLTFALRARYGYIDPFGTDSNIPDDQLFFLGGTADVRGFDENMLRFDINDDPLGGREEILGTVEARFDMGGNFELTTFYDVGAIRDFGNEDGDDDFRSTAGLGLRYITPVGPVGFLYGWKLDKKEGEDAGKFHFSLGYTF